MSGKHTFLNLERARACSEDYTLSYRSRAESIDSESHTVDSSISIHYFDNGYCTDNSLRDGEEPKVRVGHAESFSSLESINSKCSTVIANITHIPRHNNDNMQQQQYQYGERRQRETNIVSKGRSDTPTPTKFMREIEENSKKVSELLEHSKRK
jgi:hypothetical protein